MARMMPLKATIVVVAQIRALAREFISTRLFRSSVAARFPIRRAASEVAVFATVAFGSAVSFIVAEVGQADERRHPSHRPKEPAEGDGGSATSCWNHLGG